MPPRERSLVTLALAAALALLSAVHCGDDSTGRQRVGFPVFARGVRAASDNALGWRVQLDQAAVALGPMRWFEGEPLFGQLRRVFLGVAWAHPGHYVPGGALADTSTRAVVDLLRPDAVRVAAAAGVSGEVRSAHLELHPATPALGPDADALRGGSLSLRGSATRGDTVVRFEAAPRLDLNLEGIPARATLDGTPGRFEVAVDLGALLERVDFAALPRDPAAAAVAFPAESQPSNALYRGAASGASWRFTWIAGPPP